MAWQGRAQDACERGAVSVRLHEEWPLAWAAGNTNELLIIAGLLSHTHPCVHALTRGWDGGNNSGFQKSAFLFSNLSLRLCSISPVVQITSRRFPHVPLPSEHLLVLC